MSYSIKAFENFANANPNASKYLKVEVINNIPTLTVQFQSAPIKEIGVNGMQVTDLLQYVYHLYEVLNNNYPCIENKYTMQNIDTALYHQSLRTQDRIKRGVEGKNDN